VSLLAFRCATFVGAGLLFLVQPIAARQILPWFGGSSAVWTAALLFFQLGLVAGYVYAHVTKPLGTRRQSVLHLGLLLLALLTLPITAPLDWKPGDSEQPLVRVVALLAGTVGLPYVLLSATAPLLQHWQATTSPRSPYKLYVLSNIGSLGALLAYPTLVEPALTTGAQARWWSVGFAVFVAACGWCAWQLRGAALPASALASETESGAIDTGPSRVDVWHVLAWLALAACGSGLLMATSNALTQDVAAVPLLWVIPLALYLVTFILTFAGWYHRWLWAIALAAALAGAEYLLPSNEPGPLLRMGGLLLAVMFAGCMVCHGELVRSRPAPAQLTVFYMALAAGGALGGAFVTIVAPTIFDTYLELPLLQYAPAVILVAVAWRGLFKRGWLGWRGSFRLAVIAAGAIALYVNLRDPQDRARSVMAAGRSFYGVLRVEDDESGLRRLLHGRILHGSQYQTPTLRSVATTYYTEGSGVALAVRDHPRRLQRQPLNIGVVGLGTGTVAALAQPGDSINFFELDPLVEGFSRGYFTYLRDSPADIRVTLGDARLSLEREVSDPTRRHAYDVLAIDAFSGDSIPVHLLTREGFEVYRSALRPDGVLAVHITNRFLDLAPIVRAAADELGWTVLEVEVWTEARHHQLGNNWMLVTANEEFLTLARPASLPEEGHEKRLLWTDDFSSLVKVLK